MPKVRVTESIQQLFYSISWAFISLDFFCYKLHRAVGHKSHSTQKPCENLYMYCGIFGQFLNILITSSPSSAKNVAVFSGQLNLVPVILLMGLSLYTDTDNFSIMLLDCWPLWEQWCEVLPFYPNSFTSPPVCVPPYNPFPFLTLWKTPPVFSQLFADIWHLWVTLPSLSVSWCFLFHHLAKNRERERESRPDYNP